MQFPVILGWGLLCRKCRTETDPTSCSLWAFLTTETSIGIVSKSIAAWRDNRGQRL